MWGMRRPCRARRRAAQIASQPRLRTHKPPRTLEAHLHKTVLTTTSQPSRDHPDHSESGPGVRHYHKLLIFSGFLSMVTHEAFTSGSFVPNPFFSFSNSGYLDPYPCVDFVLKTGVFSVSSIEGPRFCPGVGSAQHSCVRYCRVVFSVCQNPQKSGGFVPARTSLAHNKKNDAFMF